MYRKRLSWLALLLGLQAWDAGSASAQGSDAPEPDGYTFYWPGSCVEAYRRSNTFYWRARLDTVQYRIGPDTMLPDSRRAARECTQTFAGKVVTSHNLIPLAQLYLVLGDDVQARQAIEKRLAEPDVQSTGARAWELARIVSVYLGGYPARLDAAQEFLLQLDALKGDSAAVGQFRAYYALAQYHRRMSNDSAMVAAAEQAIAAGKRLNTHGRTEFARLLLTTYRFLAEAAGNATGDSAAPLAVVRRARADLGGISIVTSLVSALERTFALYGTKGGTLMATVWMADVADSVHPRPGRLTLVNFQPSRNNIPAMRRLKAEFGDMLGIVSVVPSRGYYRGRGPLTPEIEAEYVRDEFVDELGIPGTLAFTSTAFDQLPDGRKVPQPNANNRAYLTSAGTTVVVLDKDGIIRRIWSYWSRWYEPQLQATLRKYAQ